MELSKYPPFIEGTIPAFCRSGSEYTSQVSGARILNGGLRIPYVRNSAIVEDTNYIKGFYIIIKDLNNNILREVQLRLGVENSEGNENPKSYVYGVDEDTLKKFFNNHEVLLNISENFIENVEKLNISQYYKIQLAYLVEDEPESVKVGALSAAAITKFTSVPTVKIKALEQNGVINDMQNVYNGLCTQEDITEPVYSYCFTIRDQWQQIYATSGDLIYDITTVDDNNGILNIGGIKCFGLEKSWINEFELEPNNLYEIYFTIRTLNNLVIQSPYYTICKSTELTLDDKISFNYTMDKENGSVSLRATAIDKDFKNVGGNFILMRSDESSDYKRWCEITRAAAVYNINTFKWDDRSVEQGRKYKYALVQYNDYGIYSGKLIGNDKEYIIADFEHMFLSDGERQLKIKFNPKVSSFKNTVLESKTDTIGGKYPFFFRNGDVKYKEIPISGLISYLMDEDETFIKYKDLQLDSVNKPTINLVDYNFTAERDFKLEVLEWLNNGKPKLFRSPAEGNYVIRLMNVSLSPDDKLSRMLHTFSATGYEIMPNDYNTLKANKLVATEYLVDNSNFWNTIIFSDCLKDGKFKNQEEWQPITNKQHYILEAQFSGMKPGDKIKYGDEGPEIVIGVSGTLNIKLPVDGQIYYYAKKNSYQGSVSYNYKVIEADMDFNHIESFAYENSLRTYNYYDNTNYMTEIVEASINKTQDYHKYQLNHVYYLHFYLNGTSNHLDKENWISINTTSLDDVENNHIDLLNTKELYVISPISQDIKKIWIGNNVAVDIYYQVVKIKYDYDLDGESEV